jgi:sec-independent protein translocase protein TatB
VFGLSFGELLILAIVFMVVVGPRNLPTFLRTTGRAIGKARRLVMEVRAETGIDQMLELEELRSEVDKFRRLAAGHVDLAELAKDSPPPPVRVDREREWPRIGCDAGGAVSEDEAPYLAAANAEPLPPPEPIATTR